MTDPYKDVPHSTHEPSNWPWWEPYLYTGGGFVLLAAFLFSTALFGNWLDQVPYGWLVWLGLFALAGLAELCRPMTRRSSGYWPLLLAVGFAVLAWANRQDIARWHGLGHAMLAFLYALAATRAFLGRLRSSRASAGNTDPSIDLSRPYFDPEDADSDQE